MPFDPESFNINDAKSSSQDLYEVQFPDWGIRTVAAGQIAINPNFQFPPPGAPPIPSLAGIAIGPRSTVDRCWVTWDRQKVFNATGGGGEPPTPMESRPRQLSVECPLMFTQSGQAGMPLPSVAPTPPNINNSPVTAMHNGLIYVFPKEPYPDSIGTVNQGASSNAVMTQAPATTILPVQYADQTGVARQLVPAPADSNFIAPYLELYLYLRPPLFAPPTARFPLLVSTTTPVSGGVNEFSVIGLIPIFGRRNISIGLQCLDQICDYRIGLICAVRENDPAASSPPFEIPGGSAAAVPKGQAVSFPQHNPCADYLAIYANPAAGVGHVSVQVAAYD